MKKNLLFIILTAVLLFAGCSGEKQMTNFIPTQAPEEDTLNATGGDASNTTEETAEAAETASNEATPTPKALHIGETTTKYVKLDGYDAILNVRATPSKDGEVVGFLVHTEKVKVIDITGGWASFEYNGAICYVSADFLVDERPEYIAPPTKAPTPTNAPTVTPKPAAGSTTGEQTTPPEI